MVTLVLVAHPDDEVIGLGGTIARIAKEDEVVVVIFSYGEKFPFWMKREEVIRRRVRESKRACEIIGAKEPIFLGLKDLKLAQGESRRALLELMQRYSPRRIFFHSTYDAHPDHLAVNSIVNELLEELNFSPEIYTFEINLWNWWVLREPRVIFDISETFGKKLEALSQFKSQALLMALLKPLIILRAIYYGRKSGYKYGECFYSR
jgi:LmbE family N-acetylglucosaminyl deacetylase